MGTEWINGNITLQQINLEPGQKKRKLSNFMFTSHDNNLKQQ